MIWLYCIVVVVLGVVLVTVSYTNGPIFVIMLGGFLVGHGLCLAILRAVE